MAQRKGRSRARKTGHAYRIIKPFESQSAQRAVKNIAPRKSLFVWHHRLAYARKGSRSCGGEVAGLALDEFGELLDSPFVVEFGVPLELAGEEFLHAGEAALFIADGVFVPEVGEGGEGRRDREKEDGGGAVEIHECLHAGEGVGGQYSLSLGKFVAHFGRGNGL